MNEAPDRLRGWIKEDPALTLAVGNALRFSPQLVQSQFDGTAAWMRDWQAFEGILLHMQFRVDGVCRVHGSAVLVAPGVALCATHVIQDFLDAMVEGRGGGVCVGLARHGIQFWQLNKVTCVPGSDITILGLAYAAALPPDNLFFQASLTTRYPRLGERLTICGFRAEGIDQAETLDPTIQGRVIVCGGTVRDRFPNGRDSVMLPFPAAQVDCPAWGGMSGGPVFDEKGHLVGVLCASMDAEDQAGPAYVSLLWPALGCSFEGGWPTAFFAERTSLLGLHRRLPDLCRIERPDAVTVLAQEPVYTYEVDLWN